MQITPSTTYELYKSPQIAATGQNSPSIHAPEQTAKHAGPAANSAPRPVNSAEPKMSTGMIHLLLQAQESSTKQAEDELLLETSKGRVGVDFEKLYSNTPPKPNPHLKLEDIPLLMPNAQNIGALSDFASKKFKQLLADKKIPEAPSSITYDRHGKMLLPEDYPYAQELRQALKDNPGLDRAMHDLNAISSHFAEFQALVPLHEELAAAKSQQQIDQVIAKYSHLLSDDRDYQSISLQFSQDGTISVNANNEQLKLV